LDIFIRLGYGSTHAWHCLGGHQIYCWSNPIHFTGDEVNTIDNQSELLIHDYVVQNCLRILILFSFECVVTRLGVDNFTQILMQALMHEGGLMKYLIGKKLMTFSANGVYVFQGIKLGVTQQISNEWAPHSTGVHYMAHRTNLAV
jgi:hypothetical protein